MATDLHKAQPILRLRLPRPQSGQNLRNIIEPFQMIMHRMGWDEILRTSEAFNGVMSTSNDGDVEGWSE